MKQAFIILIASIWNRHNLYAKLHVLILQGPSLFLLLSQIKAITINPYLYFHGKRVVHTSLVTEGSGLASWRGRIPDKPRQDRKREKTFNQLQHTRKASVVMLLTEPVAVRTEKAFWECGFLHMLSLG